MTAVPSKITSAAIRTRIVDTFRRDLVGPSPNDLDLARERLSDNPSRWYLTGFLAPAEDEAALGGAEPEPNDLSLVEETETTLEEPDPVEASGAAADREEPETPNTRRRFLPSSVGLTVLLPPDVRTIEAVVTWGDYRTEPPLPESVLIGESEPEVLDESGKPKRAKRQPVQWVRVPKERRVSLAVPEAGRGSPVTVPESAAEQIRRGGLTLEAHARLFEYELPDGTREQVRALTVFFTNGRRTVQRFYADAAYAFQARLELVCPEGFRARRDLSGARASDPDLRLADLHYRDLCEWAVGRNAAAAWPEGETPVTRVWTDPLPTAEVERVAPNEDKAIRDAVTFGMEDLAAAAAAGPSALAVALSALPDLYSDWIANHQRPLLTELPKRRRETADRLLAEMDTARDRIAAGIALVETNELARVAFRMMNDAVAQAARQREAQKREDRDPARVTAPAWRPFQLAFILLNLSGLALKTHPDREIADLLFFPTGGGKTEAYLGLAAFVIAHRRLTGRASSAPASRSSCAIPCAS